MDDLKITISRSFTRKKNPGNFETMDVWASYTQEIPADTPEEEQRSISQVLFEKAKEDVEAQLPNGDGVSEAEFADMLVRLANHGSVSVDEFESLNPDQLARVQELKKAWKRKDYREAKERNSSL